MYIIKHSLLFPCFHPFVHYIGYSGTVLCHLSFKCHIRMMGECLLFTTNHHMMCYLIIQINK